MRFRIITPSKTVVDVEAELVTISGSKGMFGVMPGHMKFITNINEGVVQVQAKGGSMKNYYAHGGVVQVDGDELNILSDFAEDLAATSDVVFKDQISDLNEVLKHHKDDSLEAKIIQNKISQFEGLRKFLPHI